MKQKNVTLSEDDIIKYNEEILPHINNIEPAYSLIARSKDYNIKGGQYINIEIYLTGLGIPEANKLVLIWSSPNIIDNASPGFHADCIIEAKKIIKGRNLIVPIASSEFIEKHELGKIGIMFNLPKAFFLPVPQFPIQKDDELLSPQIMSERNTEGYPPISLSLKTLKTAEAGNYEINATLTYRYKEILKQTSDKVKFRVTNWWDRNQWWVITTGTIIAFSTFFLLIATSIITLFN
jgi:hypothetical protein